MWYRITIAKQWAGFWVSYSVEKVSKSQLWSLHKDLFQSSQRAKRKEAEKLHLNANCHQPASWLAKTKESALSESTLESLKLRATHISNPNPPPHETLIRVYYCLRLSCFLQIALRYQMQRSFSALIRNAHGRCHIVTRGEIAGRALPLLPFGRP